MCPPIAHEKTNGFATARLGPELTEMEARAPQ